MRDRSVYKQQTEELTALKTGGSGRFKFQSSYMHSRA